MSATMPDKDESIQLSEFRGFLQRYAGSALGYKGAYGNHFRLHKIGWVKPDSYEVRATGDTNTWKAEPFNDGKAILITVDKSDNQKEKIPFKLIQKEDKPTPVVHPVVSIIRASCSSDRLVSVEWRVDMKKSPQLRYIIDFTKPEDTSNSSVFSYGKINPITRQVSFFVPADIPSGVYNISIRISSIFEEDSAPSTAVIVIPKA